METDSLARCEIELVAGEVKVAAAGQRLKTGLGSCIAVTLWDPLVRIGGMCHYMNATRQQPSVTGSAMDGRYSETALDLLLKRILNAGGRKQRLIGKVFGGGCMFWDSGRQRCKGSLLVQSNNLSAAQAWLARHEIAVVAEHVGGAGHRQIIFDIATGDVWVKHVPLMVS